MPSQHRGPEENAEIQVGETPTGWDDRPAERRQKGLDAGWTKKHGKSHQGYKNHVEVDRRHEPIRRYTVTDARVHHSRPLEDVLDADNTASEVSADGAYRSAETEEKLAARGLRRRIHRPDPVARLIATARSASAKSRATRPSRRSAPGSAAHRRTTGAAPCHAASASRAPKRGSG